jgi:hypothetical protein
MAATIINRPTAMVKAMINRDLWSMAVGMPAMVNQKRLSPLKIL